MIDTLAYHISEDGFAKLKDSEKEKEENCYSRFTLEAQ